jgi:hypothetical protein
MAEPWARFVAEWTEAGVIDPATASRIRTFEDGRRREHQWRWPMWIALIFGALTLGAGVLLFVAAHWDNLSPAARMAVIVGTVGLFHVAGAGLATRHPALASSCHAIGTVALGGGVFMAGQIFNMAEHWPGGVMLWALGATVAWGLLRDGLQFSLVAILVPAWLASEWAVATEFDARHAMRVPASGVFLLALTYATAVTALPAPVSRQILRWIGRLVLLPAALTLALSTDISGTMTATSRGVLALGWSAAIGSPLLLAAWLRRAEAWPNGLAAVWVIGLFALGSVSSAVPQYGWWALGAAGLVTWGTREGQGDRVNFGAAIFAATVLAFYFSEVMTKLGRSASLVGLGLVLLAGGWLFERTRRRLVRQAKEGEA